MATAFISTLSRHKKRLLQLMLLGGLVAGASLVIGQSTPPLVDLATEPLYMNGAKAKGNLSIALSVEFPTTGQTYRDEFTPTKEYIGYFDPTACYRAVLSSGSNGNYFDWQSNKGVGNFSGTCPSSQFDGNFMNWATSSAIDIMRYGLTGGNRVLDDANTTIVERAWLRDDFYDNSSYFGVKYVSQAMLDGRQENAKEKFPNGAWIYNCRNRIYFASEKDTNSNRSCTAPFGVADAQSSKLIKANANNKGNFYEVRNLVCDSNTANRRLMTYDPVTKQWKGLCFKYPNGKFKPVGQFQVNSESLRVAVFGYLNDDDKGRYGGVLRSPMKYLGPKQFDAAFNLMSTPNPRAEWNTDTGVFIDNPQSGDGTYGDQGHPRSGAIMYINKFGTLNPDAIGDYKTHDPVSELYYEVIRYLQGKQPTDGAVSLSSNATTKKTQKENYPVYSTWTNPFSGFVDSTGDAPSCLRNSILSIADVFTHADHSVPGNTRSQDGDYTRGAESNPPLDVMKWTKVVGGFESNSNVSYVDAKGDTQTTQNKQPSGNTIYGGLSNLDGQQTGAGSGSYHMAGLAYWANTQAFNESFPKARVRTFAIDVNEKRDSDDPSFRRQRQLYLAAKYGGFDDNLTNKTGNPFYPGDNTLWMGVDGDAQNYFLVSDAKKFLDSLAEVFARVVEETGSIAGGAISTTRLTANESASVYQAKFNPVANYWSGRLEKKAITTSSTGTVTIASTPTWEAGDKLTDKTKVDFGVNRNIVIGPPKGEQGTTAPTLFKWANMAATHKTAFNTLRGVLDPAGAEQGENRVNWLRGDKRNEQSATNIDGLFRARDIVLGDVVNSGIVYVGKPSLNTAGDDFKSFYDTYKTRKSVLYVNANDGMLHGFYDDTGEEAFAYVPGFVAPKMSVLPEQDYAHASFADATPAVADAKVGNNWKTVLVSGVGGGGQGVFALDVSNPANFGTSKVMWEFTDRDHAALGNVLGAPQILKFRHTNGSGTTAPTYKYYAVVASGVNNNAADGYQYTSGNASLFFLDLAFTPSATSTWQEGTNFWRIELPQSDTTIAKGLVSFSATKNAYTGAVDTLYAGDMQGNVWKLDFTTQATDSLGTNANTNFQDFNTVASNAPMFVALNGSSQRQPITGEPVVVNSFNGQKIINFGTGKFLEVNDTVVPLVPKASFYAILDGGTSAISGRSVLAAASLNTTTGVLTTAPFTWGTATNQKAGWYLDFDDTIGERQISDITSFGSLLIYGTIYPTKGSCGEGGGRVFIVDPLVGNGVSEESQVGVLAAPLVFDNTAKSTLSISDSAGRRRYTQSVGFITQGAKGMRVGTLTKTQTYIVGRMSWRQINNYQYNKNN